MRILRAALPYLARTRVVLPYLAGSAMAIVAFVILGSLHWFFIRQPGPVAFDDGYTVALAERIIDGGWLPYVDGCSHRGPLLYWAVALGQQVFGRFNWESPRYLMFCFSLLTLAGLVGTGFAARLPVAGGVAALVFVFISLAGHDPANAFGVLGEPIAGAFGIVALCFCTWGLVSAERLRARVALLGLSGFAVALAGLSKQTALTFVAPLFVWVLAGAVSIDGLSRRARVALLLAFTGGFSLALGIVLVRYAVAGELGTFWYWFYEYNVEIYMDPYRDTPYAKWFNVWLREQYWQVFAMATFATLCLARPVVESTSLRKFPQAYFSAGLGATASLMMFAGVFGMIMAKRFWNSYQLLPYPFLAMAVGAHVALVMPQFVARGLKPLVAQVVLAGFLSSWVGYISHLKVNELGAARRHGGWRAAAPDQMCRLFNRYSTSEESLFIWGFDGDLYVTCQRHPATRFTYLTLVAGTPPPAWSEPRPHRVARNSREHLMKDLVASRPPVILDMPGNMGKISLDVFPELVQYLRANYCQKPQAKTKNGRKARVWIRNDRCDRR